MSFPKSSWLSKVHPKELVVRWPSFLCMTMIVLHVYLDIICSCLLCLLSKVIVLIMNTPIMCVQRLFSVSLHIRSVTIAAHAIRIMFGICRKDKYLPSQIFITSLSRILHIDCYTVCCGANFSGTSNRWVSFYSIQAAIFAIQGLFEEAYEAVPLFVSCITTLAIKSSQDCLWFSYIT